ncbi:MAG: hypothetical protein US41_C0040G0012 [Parcubacteria group bacterium GW2011_GWB1_37_13]|nr:MAG: hypothetical protein US41_C0040G0012 [Parcubacteria group bacterium GW2011_GWB1_37_13]
MSIKNQENRICEHCGQNFKITEEEFSLYKKVGTELPTLCFFCRIKLHLSFWMFGKFRKGKSDLSGVNLITVLPEKNRYPIYTLTEWHSDKWNAMKYGVDYDTNVSFLKQLQDLQEKIGAMMFGILKIAICLVRWKNARIYFIHIATSESKILLI